jgi:hypothetical protein
MNRDEWTALAERCESTAGPDRDIERCMCRLIPDGFQMVPFSEFTASLDAITALIARELPEPRDAVARMRMRDPAGARA